MAAPPPQTAEHAAAELSHDPDVAWSEPMHVYHAEAGPGGGRGDPLFRAQPAAREWRLAELHKIATGRGVLVAVIDSKVQADHPDLAGQVAASEDFAPQRAHGAEQHGTAVAGIIAANEGDGIGIAGVAPQAKLLALRACWQQGPSAAETVCDTLSLAKALHFAIERSAQVINMSLAGPPDLLLGKLVDLALTRGATVVAAYDTHLPRGGFPASHAGVIAVAEESMARLPAGVYTAPGRDVPTTEPGGRWSLVDGSSYAAAHVSGLAALARQRAVGTGGGLALVAARSDGGAIDACATLGRGLRPCGPALGGETRISLRR
jgi:subtilisin family serine protease